MLGCQDGKTSRGLASAWPVRQEHNNHGRSIRTTTTMTTTTTTTTTTTETQTT
ncbi:hypothetical protein ALC60_08801 [Trachymyrmex zeteki]|uniref:Uncharacterized protein n=1 Tax=Mycetomoellerius zeteki TaxID=64791 RepID=A0A151WWJ4_9HYME|nr:hypothetical protein ALC60_08801 [Trachymyrmex zeteki]